ncbi:transporter substrate-binding domain-containing protein [Aquamicrobium terrae]|uniref:Polar amino acid transport system substrate-binding protein n=1 Tax=Aquamicrobium terrae TaxID=1324945 RepID=A0ABV2N6W6_9HYPH
MRRLMSLIMGATMAIAGCVMAQAQTTDEIVKKGTLSVAIDITNPPYGGLDNSMEPAGIDVDIAKLMAERLGVKLNIVQVTGPNRIPTLLNNRADVVIASFAPTAERALQVAFSEPYTNAQQVIVARKDRTVSKAEDTSGMKVAVVRGNAQDVAFTAVAPSDAEIMRFDDDAGTIQALYSGQADALVIGNVAAEAAIRQGPPDQFEVKLSIRDNPMAVGMRRDQWNLLQWINTFIFNMKFTGELRAIHEAHGVPYPY